MEPVFGLDNATAFSEKARSPELQPTQSTGSLNLMHPVRDGFPIPDIYLFIYFHFNAFISSQVPLWGWFLVGGVHPGILSATLGVDGRHV